MRSKNFSLTNSSAQLAMIAILSSSTFSACNNVVDSADDIAAAAAEEYTAQTRNTSVTVSGVSAGAYMAVQTHIALADRVAGAGIIAGGPYHCASGNITRALGPCMSGDDLDVAPLVSYTGEAAVAGNIADTDSIKNARVWIFHSAKDQIVGQNVATALAAFYAEFVAPDQIKFVDNVDAAHGWPTLQYGQDCLEMGGDFLNACDFDAAGSLLNYLIDDLHPRVADTDDKALIGIDLSAHLPAGSSIAKEGFIFVPNGCRQSDADCRLHIAFHGCRQGMEFVENRFAANAGLNEWAADNRLVVIYPQIESSTMNPQGCWDWWGYTGPEYDQKSGKQIAAMDAIMTAFDEQRLY